MAANPLPPQQPLRRDETVKAQEPGHFPWGMVGAILVLICLGLLAYYFFR